MDGRDVPVVLHCTGGVPEVLRKKLQLIGGLISVICVVKYKAFGIDIVN